MGLKNALRSRSLRRTSSYHDERWIDPSKAWFGSNKVLHKRWQRIQARMNARVEDALRIELVFWKKLIQGKQKVADVGVFRSAVRRIRDLSRDLNLPESTYTVDLSRARRQWCIMRAKEKVRETLTWCRGESSSVRPSLDEARDFLKRGNLTFTDIGVSLPSLLNRIKEKERRDAKNQERHYVKLLRARVSATRTSQRWLAGVLWIKKKYKFSDRELGIRKGELENWERIVYPPQ